MTELCNFDWKTAGAEDKIKVGITVSGLDCIYILYILACSATVVTLMMVSVMKLMPALRSIAQWRLAVPSVQV